MNKIIKQLCNFKTNLNSERQDIQFNNLLFCILHLGLQSETLVFYMARQLVIFFRPFFFLLNFVVESMKHILYDIGEEKKDYINGLLYILIN